MASSLLDPVSMSSGVAVSISSSTPTSWLFKVLATELLDSAFMASFVILDFIPADFLSPALLPFGPGSVRPGRGGTSRGVGDGLRDKPCERRRVLISLLPNSCNRWGFVNGTKKAWHGCGSGSVIYLYGSGSFYQQANKLRKTLISTVLWLLYDFYLSRIM